jgi:Protein of unknown function (DUF551)
VTAEFIICEKEFAVEWISIREKLPPKGDRALLFTPYGFFGDDHSCIGDVESITECTAEIGGEMVPVFTHWMPLPRTPRSTL